MQLQARPSGPLTGRARPPGDKSISHRALILAAMAPGESGIEGLLEGADVLATAAAVAAFGAQPIRTAAGAWRVQGRARFTAPAGEIDCGNSGTGVRLLMGAAAGFALTARFTGDASLRSRPMNRIIAPLSEMGARFEAREGGRLPLTLHGGGLRRIAYRLPVASAQVKSAVLLAGLNAEGGADVIEPEATRDHTERMLAAFAWAPTITHDADGARRIAVSGGARLSPAHIAVPADPSSAAFPLVAALITPGSRVRLENLLLNPLRTGLFTTLLEMGAKIAIEGERESGGESIGDLIAEHSELKGVIVPPERAPSMIDEYPILAIAAAFAEGETVMRGIGEMRVKESDRIALTVAGLRACGVEAEEEPEAMIVRGSGARPRGAALVRTQGDHRIAMAHLVLGLAAREPVAVDEAAMIETSFPGFANFMRALGAEIAET